MDAHVEVATPCLFKITACSVMKTPCSRTNLQGKLRSYYHGIRYVDKIENKTLDVSDLPPGWFTITREDGGATLFRKCEVKVNGYSVVEHIHIDDKGRITLQIGPNTIDPAQVGLPNNFYESILPLMIFCPLLSHAQWCVWARRWLKNLAISPLPYQMETHIMVGSPSSVLDMFLWHREAGYARNVCQSISLNLKQTLPMIL